MWIQAVAPTSRHAEVIGIDPSEQNVAYANARLRCCGYHHAHCQVLDIREPVPFPHTRFDLIQGRLLTTLLPEHAWLPLLERCKGALRPGGMLRLIECQIAHSNSAAYTLLSTWYLHLLWQAGRRDSPAASLPPLLDLLERAGYQQRKELVETLDFSAGRPMHQTMSLLLASLFRQLQAIVVSSGKSPDSC